jgi:hypothetical protein
VSLANSSNETITLHCVSHKCSDGAAHTYCITSVISVVLDATPSDDQDYQYPRINSVIQRGWRTSPGAGSNSRT